MKIRATKPEDSLLCDQHGSSNNSVDFLSLEKKTEIFVYAADRVEQDELEQVFFHDMNLKQHTTLFTDACTILKQIKLLFNDKGANQVALVLIDQEMAGMSGTQLINETFAFMSS